VEEENLLFSRPLRALYITRQKKKRKREGESLSLSLSRREKIPTVVLVVLVVVEGKEGKGERGEEMRFSSPSLSLSLCVPRFVLSLSFFSLLCAR